MRSTHVFAAWTLLAGGLLAGCASPGNPRPPSLNLPDKVTDLTATRIGDRVKISWTPPTRTTDGVDIGFPVTVEICRDLAVPPPAGRSRKPVRTPCTSVRRIAGHAGPSNAEDTLTGSLAAGRRIALAYRLRVLNPAGRSGDPSAPVFVASGPAEPRVESFHAKQTRPGVVLEWAPEDPGSVVEVTRVLVQPPGSPPPVAKPKGNEIPVGKKKDPAAPVLLRPASPAPGMLDPVPVMGGTYTYTAQRISNVELAGHPLELRSEPTAAITLVLRDTFPPDAPRGLISVPGTLANRATLDLSWDANVEADLGGYRVYRVDLAEAGSAPRLLTPEVLASPAYRDSTVVPGHRYRYQVTAVDRTGNESAPSAFVEDAPQ